MSSMIEKIQRRRCYPIELDNGETIHVRSLSWQDKLALNSIESTEDQLAYAIGRCLVNENSERCLDRSAEEDVADYVTRVRMLTDDLSFGELTALSAAITKTSKVPPAENLVKNSEPTETPAS